MTKDFAPIPGWEGQYEITTSGVVRSCAHSRSHWRGGERRYQATVLRQEAHSTGYARVVLCRGARIRRAFVHTLVLETFVGPRPPRHVARHINGNPTDNRAENLCWGTHHDNSEDKLRHGRLLAGSRHPMAKLSVAQLDAARRLRQEGATATEIAARFGVTAGHIRKLTSNLRKQPPHKE